MPRRNRKPRKARAAMGDPMVDIVEVDNPGYQIGNPESIRKVQAVRSLRDNPLRRMHARKQITDDEYEAGRHCEAAYEDAGHRIAAQDPTREPVDGSHALPDITTDRRNRAAKLIGRIIGVIGKDGERMLRDVLAERKFLAQVAQERGDASERGERFYARLFRTYLGAVAVEFGLRTGVAR